MSQTGCKAGAALALESASLRELEVFGDRLTFGRVVFGRLAIGSGCGAAFSIAWLTTIQRTRNPIIEIAIV